MMTSRKEYTVPSSLFRISQFQFVLVILVVLFSCCCFCQALAESASTEEWNISADKIARYEDPNSIVAQGNVVLTKQEKMAPKRSAEEIRSSLWAELLEEKVEKSAPSAQDIGKKPVTEYQTTMTIQADWMVYDVDVKTIKAKGNVRITTQDDQLFAKEGTLHLIDETGNFSDATILHKGNTLHLEGKKIEKTGIDTYRISKGWVITCKLEEGQTPPWSFSSTETNVRQNGFALLKHAKFNIRNVPVFYAPYLLVPVNNNRHTGFLFPEFSSSSNSGFGLNVPFFLNISDSADATFYPEYLTKRGFMPGVEFRYVSSESNKGTITANYLDDNLDPSETDYTHDNSERYWLRGKADYTFADWQTRLDLDIVSDQDYLNEFDSGITGFEKTYNRYLDTFGRGFQNQSDTERENTLKTLRTWDGMALQINLLAVNDASTTASSFDTPLWELPSIDYSGVMPLGETYFSLDWDANYVNYWREDGIGGHRVDLNPSISTPIPLGAYLESRAELGIRDTFYVVETYGEEVWDNDDIQNRIYPEFEIEVATTLEKDFFSGSGSDRTAAHQLRPYVKYGYLPDVNQDNLPYFDDVDLIDNKELITYGVDNYFNTFTHTEGSGENLYTVAELKIEQSYDLRESVSEEPLSDIYTKLKWRPLPRISISYKNYFDVYENVFNIHTLDSQYTNSRGDYLYLDYSFNNEKDIEQINSAFLAHLINGWLVGGSLEHSISEDETVEARGFLTYQAPCWSVKFETRHTPDDTSFLVVFSLANIGLPLGVSF